MTRPRRTSKACKKVSKRQKKAKNGSEATPRPFAWMPDDIWIIILSHCKVINPDDWESDGWGWDVEVVNDHHESHRLFAAISRVNKQLYRLATPNLWTNIQLNLCSWRTLKLFTRSVVQHPHCALRVRGIHFCRPLGWRVYSETQGIPANERGPYLRLCNKATRASFYDEDLKKQMLAAIRTQIWCPKDWRYYPKNGWHVWFADAEAVIVLTHCLRIEHIRLGIYQAETARLITRLCRTKEHLYIQCSMGLTVQFLRQVAARQQLDGPQPNIPLTALRRFAVDSWGTKPETVRRMSGVMSMPSVKELYLAHMDLCEPIRRSDEALIRASHQDSNLERLYLRLKFWRYHAQDIGTLLTVFQNLTHLEIDGSSQHSASYPEFLRLEFDVLGHALRQCCRKLRSLRLRDVTTSGGPIGDLRQMSELRYLCIPLQGVFESGGHMQTYGWNEEDCIANVLPLSLMDIQLYHGYALDSYPAGFLEIQIELLLSATAGYTSLRHVDLVVSKRISEQTFADALREMDCYVYPLRSRDQNPRDDVDQHLDHIDSFTWAPDFRYCIGRTSFLDGNTLTILSNRS